VTDPYPLPLEAQSFSIGGVLALAGRAIASRFVALAIASAAAGAAAVLVPFGVLLQWPELAALGAHPLIRELIQVALAIAIVTPATVLVLRGLAGASIDMRAVAGVSARRLPIVVLCQMATDFAIVAPIYYLALPLSIVFTAYLIYEIPLLAFNYVFWAVLAAEQVGPFQAIRRTFRLLSGRWLRMCLLTLLLWLVSVMIIFALQFATGAFVFNSWALLGTGALSFGIRLFIVVPFAAASYRALIQEKEGLEHAVRVFD
jgi:hypothetical protein